MATENIRKPRGTYHHGDLKNALVRATLELIERSGLENLSLRAVARRAGVSTAAPYRHFASREALLAVIAERGYDLLTETMREVMEPAGEDPVERLVASGVGYVRFAVSNPAHYAVMFSPELVDKTEYPELREASERSFGILLHGMIDAQLAGAVRSAPPLDLALAAWSSVHGLASLIAMGQVAGLHLSDEPAVLAERVSRMLFEGLRA